MTTNRFSLIVASSVIAVLAVLTISSMATSPRKPAVSSAYDQIDLQRAAQYHAAAAQQAYLDQRHGEQTVGENHILSDAAYRRLVYLQFRRGEWTAGKIVVVRPASLPFRQAEQIASAADAQRAYLAYREGEWNAGGATPSADRSYDAVELLRAARGTN